MFGGIEFHKITYTNGRKEIKFPFTWDVNLVDVNGIMTLNIPTHFTTIYGIDVSLNRMATNINLGPVFVTENQVMNATTIQVKIALLTPSITKPSMSINCFITCFGY